MNIIFQAEKKRPKITAAELENQTSRILPNREELVVMDYSMLNNPYYAAPGYGSYGYSSYASPYAFQQPSYVPMQYYSNNYDWAGNGNFYAYGNYPEQTHYTPDCNYQIYAKIDYGDWRHDDWNWDDHDYWNDDNDWSHDNYRADYSYWGEDNWENWAV